MPDPFRQPFDPLFNYASVSRELEAFAPQLTALGDLVAYGTHLVPRLLKGGEASPARQIVLAQLGRDALSAADGLVVLSRVGAVDAARLQLRALFESCAYTRWILAGDREERAEACDQARRGRELRWVDGAGAALEAIADSIGWGDQYAAIFNGRNGRVASGGEIEPLRDLSKFPIVLQVTMDLLLAHFQRLIEEYNANEMARFASQRATFWTPPFPAPTG